MLCARPRPAEARTGEEMEVEFFLPEDFEAVGYLLRHDEARRATCLLRADGACLPTPPPLPPSPSRRGIMDESGALVGHDDPAGGMSTGSSDVLEGLRGEAQQRERVRALGGTLPRQGSWTRRKSPSAGGWQVGFKTHGRSRYQSPVEFRLAWDCE